MKNREAALRRYCRRVRANLPCGWKQKRKIMEEFKACVDAYVKESPEWDLPQLEAELGSAQQIAGTYVDNLETKELLRSLLVRKRLVALAAVALIALVAVQGGVMGYQLWNDYNNTHGYIVEATYEMPLDVSNVNGVIEIPRSAITAVVDGVIQVPVEVISARIFGVNPVPAK